VEAERGAALGRQRRNGDTGVTNLNLSVATRWGLNVLILLSIIGALYLGEKIFIPTVFALLLAALLWPAVAGLHQHGVPLPCLARGGTFPWIRFACWRLRFPWGLACILVMSGLVALTLLITLGFGLAITKMVQDLAIQSPEKQQEVYSRFRQKLESVSPVPLDPHYLPEDANDSPLFKSAKEALDPQKSYFIDFLLRIGGYGGSWIWEWILIMFILLFLLLEGPMLGRRVVEIFGPSPEVQAKVGIALADMARQVRTYLVWRTIINLALALWLGLIYQFVGLKEGWTWALLSSILWYVPYLGPIVAGVPPVLDAFISCDSPWVAVAILVLYTVLLILEGYLIYPLVIGRNMELNSTTVMLACLFWELVWGIPGLFLAMPLMAGIKAICWHVPGWRAWANLMGTRGDEPLPAEKRQAGVAALLEDNGKG
jgi:predicted PurR-regulated permease PerM